MTWLTLLVAAAVINLIAAEIFDWFPWLAERLIRRAVHRLPPDTRERYLDEWLGELDAVPGRGVSRLLFAAFVLAGAAKVSHELAGSPGGSITSLALKRVFDRTIALAGLVLLAPAMLAIALAVRISSRGPVVFRALRRGIDEKLIVCLQFRTMHPDALDRQRNLEDTPRPLYRIGDDPRLTPVGARLRRASLDHLPRLINVLRGEVSLVGPQLLPEAIHAQLDVRHRKRRSLVKPRITSLTQLEMRREDSITLERFAELDDYYIAHRTILLDLKILALSAWAWLREPPH